MLINSFCPPFFSGDFFFFYLKITDVNDIMYVENMGGNNMKNNKVLKIVIGIVALIVAVAALLGVYYAFREKPENPNLGPSSEGSTSFDEKQVTIEVINSKSESVLYEISTHADYLEETMNEADGLTYEATDGMVMVINGERADYVLDGAYWAFYVNGEYCNYGISDQPVNNGDIFKIEYTKA